MPKLPRTPRRPRLAGAAILTTLGLAATIVFVGLGGSALGGTTSAALAQYAPVNSSPPTISGSAQVGQTLTAQVGVWSNSPTAYSYQWQRCDTGGNACSTIGGATGSTYAVGSADAGHTIRVVVTASNSSGVVSALSGQTAVVPGAAVPSGSGAIPASSVPSTDRLVIDQVQFSPNPVRTRATTVTARFHVSDSSGRSVSGALVYMIGLPYNRITNPPELPTASDGWATLQFTPTSKFPIIRGGALVVFVRARTPQGDVLGGSSTRRLVQLNVTTP